jgi:RsiW-degrading membrane proteinase PrsW (M82 family)
MILFLFVDRMITPLFFWDKLNKGYVIIGATIYFTVFYFLVYNKKRWAGYIEEFKDESEEDRRSGNWLVRAYLIGSVLLFFISLPILFSLGKH